MKFSFPVAVATLSLASVAYVALQPSQSTSEPTRVLLSWNGDPATQAAVTWRTGSLTGQPTIQFLESSADPRSFKDANSVNASSAPLDLAEGGSAVYHTGTLLGLKPETKYSYRVGDGQSWSEWFDFRTASKSAKPFTFIYFGDAQNDVKSMWSRVIRQSVKDAPYADFMLHAGDLINVPEADAEWGEWFYAGGWLHATIPSVSTPGNHEYKSGKITRLWQPQFEYPRNGVPGLEDSNYYIDYQGARLISLNSLEKTQEQAEWLDQLLAKTKMNWVILTFHYPMYSTAKGRDNKALRELWLPIILKHKVDLVLQGHDHSYGRHAMPHNVGTGVRGTVGKTHFVVSVSGPKMYNLGEDALTRMDKSGEYKQLYQVITVEPKVIKYRAHLATGALYDSFEIKK
jgi:3',5'-cyclic AMP phosphodiesterase CpdA